MAGDISHLLPSTKRRVEAVLADPRLRSVRGGVYVTSGCRSRALQERLRWNYLHVPGSPLAAVPGTSPHEIGAKGHPGYCVAADLGFRNGNPPYGNISNRPSWVARHPDWALLERVCNDHGLIRTVRSEEWHYQESGSPPLVIVPPPEEFMAVATQADLNSLKAGVLYSASAHHQLTVARKERDGSNPTVLLRLNRLDKLCRALLVLAKEQGADIDKIMAEVTADEEVGDSFEAELRAATPLEADHQAPPPG